MEMSRRQMRLTVSWAVLVGITLFAWRIGAHHEPGPLRPEAAIAFSAIAITLIKVRVIMREFMDLRTAPACLKRVTDAWLAVFGAAMLVAYFV